jgi:hypothetical protein
MARCIVHVGMHKTGTSSIQQSLDGFEDADFLYADSGMPNHSSVVFEMLGFKRPERGGEGRRRPAAPAAAAIARFRQSMAHAGKRTFLISGEGISILPRHKLVKLKSLLSEFFDEIVIFAAVRPPASYVASVFQGPVRNGMRSHIEIHLRSYQRLFHKFDEVFGRENVRLWKFDPKSYPGGCAVRDFCGRAGIRLPAERVVRVNESLSREALGLLFAYRTFAPQLGFTEMTRAQNNQLLAGLLKIGSARFRFSPDLIRPVLDGARGDIAWMETRLGQSLDEQLGEHKPGDVRVEGDLLEPDPRAVAELLALLGDAVPDGIRGETPVEVARLVHALRENTVKADVRVGVNVLIREIRRAQPRLLESVDEHRAEKLVLRVFRQINDTLSNREKGTLECAGLGRFRMRSVSKEVDGRPVNRKQVFFDASPGGRPREGEFKDAATAR